MFNQESRVLDPRKSQSIAFLLSTLDLSTYDVLQALRDAGKESRELRNYSSSDSPATSPPSVDISPVRRNKRNHVASSLRMFTLWNQNHAFPRISSASTSPERGAGGGGTIRTPDAYARSSMYSSVSTTPDRFFRKVLEASSPPRWNDFSRNVKSLFLSSASSPARDFCIDNVSESSSRKLKSSPAATPPPPPPPERPPPAMPAPPPLVPPSQSFMVHKSGKKLSWDGATKMKPLPWERVHRPSSCRKNTWESLKFNSFNANPKQRSLSCDLPMFNQESRVLDPRKSQSIAFLLSTLDLSTYDVLQALRDGHYEALGVELLESLSPWR
ncbi:hypothetical protein Bca52824_067903 [Brassica carinata]|uniref:FH2 domain-containing protein n=1 Tax=Brassica carinata TaxID=52824 RepID=A0A8X7QTC0_BRACI|nr:hypothetical protein Bca52824_067903 [Brassica carinata]